MLHILFPFIKYIYVHIYNNKKIGVDCPLTINHHHDFMPPSGDNIPPRLLIRVFYELYAQTSQKKNIFIKNINFFFSVGGKLENKVVDFKE